MSTRWSFGLRPYVVRQLVVRVLPAVGASLWNWTLTRSEILQPLPNHVRVRWPTKTRAALPKPDVNPAVRTAQSLPHWITRVLNGYWVIQSELGHKLPCVVLMCTHARTWLSPWGQRQPFTSTIQPRGSHTSPKYHNSSPLSPPSWYTAMYDQSWNTTSYRKIPNVRSSD